MTLDVIFAPDGFSIDFPEGKKDEQIERWRSLYREDKSTFLFHLAFEALPQQTSSTFRFLHQVAHTFSTALTRQSALEITREQTEVPLDPASCDSLLAAVPFGLGTDAIGEAWLRDRFHALESVFRREIAAYDGTVAMYLAEKIEDLHLPERIFFHMVENRKDETYPFAFLATYTTRDAAGVRHMPLGYALTEYKKSREKLVSLLSCLNGAAEALPMVAAWMETGELFHPLRMTSAEAYTFLQAVPELEKAGIACRLPNFWRTRSSSVRLQVQLGEKKESLLGLDSILSIRPSLVVDGVRLTQADLRTLLRAEDGLALIKGKWVEVNHEQLKKMIADMEACKGDMSLLRALRIQGGLENPSESGAEITNGKWLSTLLSSLRHPDSLRTLAVPKGVCAVLRPYQKNGYAWLSQMLALGFGACLADDMGLGKTLQVLTVLERLRDTQPDLHVLLIVPASLIENWEKEIEKFVPHLPVCLLHGLTPKKAEEKLQEPENFLYLTTYGMVPRLSALEEREWDLIILDEAQAIKNPGTRQTRAVKQLRGRTRLAMTGTPIENDLTNLWSLFDFLNPGLLGSASEFDRFAKGLSARPSGYVHLKEMVSPFILRRMKTDKAIISDLPDKIEQTDYITLSKKQTALYEQQIEETKKALTEIHLQEADPMKRRGLVVSAIGKLKQICNHPDQFLGQETFLPEESGKFEYLREICGTIRDKHERVLIFTQYREITPALDHFLYSVFGRRGLVLHGGTRVSERARLVAEFNSENYVPYMVLTIKAGGTGLNLTGANHVILFDRWWNPAVENQAMDRAFRIGQTRDVFVHRFVVRGTIEEKIDQLIRDKQKLADDIVGEGSEKWITEMSDAELLGMMKLEV